MKRKQLADFENWYIHHETEKAFLVCEERVSVYDKNTRKYWIPKSIMEYEEKGDGRIDFTIPQEFAEEKGMV